MAERPWKFICSGSPECLPKVSSIDGMMEWKATQLWMAAPPQKIFFFETDGLKHHPFGVSGMRPFMDGIIENKVGNSLDSSLENRERERHWSHWRLRIINLAVTETEIWKPLCILISDSRIDDLSYIFLSFPHIFNLTSSTFFQSKVFSPLIIRIL